MTPNMMDDDSQERCSGKNKNQNLARMRYFPLAGRRVGPAALKPGLSCTQLWREEDGISFLLLQAISS
jgi:hypothetical protein